MRNKQRKSVFYIPVYLHSKLEYRTAIEAMLFCAAMIFASAASGLAAGAPGRLGPAHVPLALAAATALAALACLARPGGEPDPSAGDPCAALAEVPASALARLLGAILLFAATIGPLGLFLAGGLCGTIAARATLGARLLPALVAGSAVTLLVAGLFVGIVGQPLPLLPVFMR